MIFVGKAEGKRSPGEIGIDRSIYRVIQEEGVNILGDDSIGHCEKKAHMNMCLILNVFRDRAV